MSCENVQKRISLLLDCKLPVGEREHVLAHLDACGQCGGRFESMQNMRASLRDMARPRVPAALSIKLRILASHERARWIARKNHLYYALSTFGSRNSAIGLATNPTLDPADPKYNWTDEGMVLRSFQDKDDWNAIDPNLEGAQHHAFVGPIVLG